MNLRKFNKNIKKEFNNTFNDNFEVIEPKPITRRRFSFKIRFGLCVWVVLGFFVIQHFGVQLYNLGLEHEKKEIVTNSSNLTKIDETKPIKSQLNYYEEEKKSLLQSIQLIGCGSKAQDNGIPGGEDTNSGASNDAYGTNVQEIGIDEADIAKSDGKYIYSLVNSGGLYVYDLNGKVIDTEKVDSNKLYIYNEKVVCIGNFSVYIYTFDGMNLELINTIEKIYYCSSRLVENELFIVSYSYLDTYLKQECYGDLYYDNCINPTGVICMYKYDLDTNEIKKIDVITAYSAILYASNNYFYIASCNYAHGYYSFISIVDYNLNPVGTLVVEGQINNQFSMDEYNNHLRVVSIDVTNNPLEINQLSIFNLDTLERVGYLNEGIGLEYQTVRSVRFDEDACYVVTYFNKDPLYKIDISDVTNPKIVSIFESPGYSTYLHNFVINGQKYSFGLGYTDSRYKKLTIYIDNGEETIQLGNELWFVEKGKTHYNKWIDLYRVEHIHYNTIVNNHKSLFIYNDGSYLYIGGYVDKGLYTVFKIDVTQENHVISVYKEYSNLDIDKETRAFLIDGKFYVLENENLVVDDWS